MKNGFYFQGVLIAETPSIFVINDRKVGKMEIRKDEISVHFQKEVE